ncbi:ParA family protein [Stieleria magnilauensis]|uniref:MinD/ParA/CobQ/CobA-like protein n=1 Tax=Stieleria magnilauensis TaxID=2527963 RepID=A0ABX5XHP3_9BACT|nr:MinD/ParA/CobQ/CobA-like protein [Planctomycetes bacterium TBK1r]
MAKTICMIAEKGGVGRTTNAVNIAALFASQGARVMIIDTDPQSSVSKFFLGTAGVYDLHKSNTIAACFDERYIPEVKDLVHATNIENLYLTPASDRLKDHNLPKPSTLGDLQFGIRDYVAEANQSFDFIVIDCPPDIGNLPTWASLLASDYAITPIVPERFSVQAISGVDAQLAAAHEVNTKLRFLGYFLSQRRTRLSLHDAMEKHLRDIQRDRVFDTVIPQMIAFAEAQQHGLPITSHDSSSEAARVTAKLGKEIIDRIAQENQSRRAA